MAALPAAPPSRPSPLWQLAGIALMVGAVTADFFGIGGGPGIGLRQLAVFIAGSALVAMQMWWAGPRASMLTCIAVWVAVGLLCGFTESLYTYWIKQRGSLSFRTDDYHWVLSLSYLLAFGLLGAVCGVGAKLFPRLLSLPVVMVVPALFASWSLLSRLAWLDEVVTMMLALGIAIALGRMAAARPASTAAGARIAALGMVIALGVIATWDTVVDRAAEAERLEALPPAREDAINVLLIVLDTVRVDRFGVYGSERKATPNMDKLAMSGAVFDWAIATAPWTLTSHASIFTGRYPHEQSADWLKPLDSRHPTLAEALRDQGYVTGGFAANLWYCASETGLARGFVHYDDHQLNWRTLVGEPNLGRQILRKAICKAHHLILRNSAAEVRELFVSWLDEVPDDRPFFAFLNLFDAHATYLAPPPFDTKYGTPGRFLYELGQRSERWSGWSPREAKGLIDAYDGCVAFIDQQIGLLADELTTRGILDETLLIITADHGELFGEHDLQEHGNSLYRPLVHVPLIVRLPAAVPNGMRVPEVVSLADIPATVLDLVGAVANSELPGHSLAPLWSGGSAPRSPALSEVSKMLARAQHLPAARSAMKSIFLDNLHYIRHEADQTEALYDVHEDPAEEHNLIDSAPDAAARMRAALEAALARS